MSKAPIQRYYIYGGNGNERYWFLTLGWVAYYFAQLEWSSYAVIDRLENNNDKLRVTKQNFMKRTTRAAELVDIQLAKSNASLAAEWATFWKRAIAAAQVFCITRLPSTFMECSLSEIQKASN